MIFIFKFCNNHFNGSYCIPACSCSSRERTWKVERNHPGEGLCCAVENIQFYSGIPFSTIVLLGMSSVLWGIFSTVEGNHKTLGDVISTVENIQYHRGITIQYCGDIQYCGETAFVLWRIFSTVEGYQQYCGGCYQYCGWGYSVLESYTIQYCGGIPFSTVGILSTWEGHHLYYGEYSVLWRKLSSV